MASQQEPGDAVDNEAEADPPATRQSGRSRAAKSRSRRAVAAPEEFHAERLKRGRAATNSDATAIEIADGTASIRLGIGRRVRQLRVMRGLSVKGLASASGVTPGMISQVERGTVMPSIGTLVRIAAAVGLNVGGFFDAAAPAGMVVRVSQRVVYEYPLTGVHDSLVSSDPAGRLQVFWTLLEPGATSGPDLLEHGSEAEVVVVVAGAAEIVVGDERIPLGEGDAVTFSGSVPHGFANPHDEPASLLWVVTPATY